MSPYPVVATCHFIIGLNVFLVLVLFWNFGNGPFWKPWTILVLMLSKLMVSVPIFKRR